MAEPSPRPSRPQPPPRAAPGGRRSAGREPRGQPRSPAAATPTLASPRRGWSWRQIPAPLRWLGAAVSLLVIALAILVALFQWNWLRGPIDRYASAQLQRQVTIHGALAGHVWSWTPSLTADDVTVAEPGWAGAGQMVAIPRLTVAIDLKALLSRRAVVVSLVDAEHPTVRMIRDGAGRNNWTFGAPTKAPQPLKLPPIRSFTIKDGRLTFDDAQRKLHFTGRVSSNERLAGYGAGRFTMTGQGTLNGAAFMASIVGGPLINVDPNRPYPFQSDIHAGATHIVATGTITRPFDLADMQASGRASGQDLARLYDLTGYALPSTPPYDLTGHVTRTGNRFDIAGIHGRMGSSDLAGHLIASEANGRRDLTGTLVSQRLKLADLTAVIGGAPRGVVKATVTSPEQQAMAAKLTAERRIFPDARLDVARLRQMDADVRYTAASVDAGPLPIRQAVLHVRLDHGLMTIDPFSLVLPVGALSGSVGLDARGSVPLTSVNLTLAHAQVQELLPKSANQAAIQGSLVGHVRLTGAGDSMRAAAATASGVMAVAIPQGQMRQLFAELMGIDVGRSLFLYLSHDQKPTPVRCAVAEFRANNGVLTAQRLLIDTGAVQAQGAGVIDLRDETLNLSLNGKPKHFRLIHLAAPITLKGRLDEPKVGVDLGKALPQLGAAAALGVVASPLAAIVPFVSLGTTKDADCGALLAEAAADGAPANAPVRAPKRH
jgi:AsmA family protein